VGWIWDPLKLPFTARNPDMANGRHAVSIDERRCYFRNNLWGTPFPGQDIKQVWFSGVHSDVGGSYPSAQSGLSRISLQWMLCEAVALGLLVNPDMAKGVLGRVPSFPGVCPDPAQREHNSLTLPWWILEVFPHSFYDITTKKKKWRIPLGASRAIPPGSSFHESVWKKLEADSTYRPKNLPSDWTTNPDWKSCAAPDNPCDFLQEANQQEGS
jgi:uncharacterized protein (DUF2235 family)